MLLEELNSKTVVELKKIAKKLDIKGYYKLRKQELVELIQLAQVLEMMPPEEIECECESEKDVFGINIFNTVVSKYETDSPFKRSKESVKENYRNKAITKEGRDFLIKSVIEPYHEMFSKFVNQVRKERTFKEKASSSSKLRKIVTSQDWAEAIIEIEDTVSKFRGVIFDQVKSMMNDKTLTRQCANLVISECNKPCKVKKNRKLKKVCTY